MLAPSQLTNPVASALPFAAALVLAAGVLAGRYWRQRSPVVHFLVRLAAFAALTALMLASRIIPYEPTAASAPIPVRFWSAALDLIWWTSAAWLVAGFLRAFVSFGRRGREAKLIQDLLAGVIYVTAGVAIAANVFDLPIKGLLATSGALAIIIGLALQSSLGDVFSGIVLNIERPYRAGDWIILDESVQGQVIETNWRATHILTGRQDVAIVPNSLIAKQKIVNCSAPTQRHGVSLRVKLEPTISPAAACELLTGVLLGVSSVLPTPPPAVGVRDLSAEALELELSFSVADIGQADKAQNEIFERLYRATNAAGLRFSPRLSGSGAPPSPAVHLTPETMPQRLVSGVALFAGLAPEEKADLARRMLRRVYEPGAIVLTKGTVAQALHIVVSGVLAAWSGTGADRREVLRLVVGDYFGELGLLTGSPLDGEISALTRAVVYELPADALAPLLKTRPSLAQQLSEGLAARKLARETVLDPNPAPAEASDRLAGRLATGIRRLFSLDVHS